MPAVNFFEMSESCNISRTFGFYNDLINKSKRMEKLITRKEAAEILGISIATLDTARNNGLISYVQYVQNGCVYFTAAGLQEYIAKCTHRAKPVERSTTYRKPRSGRS